MQFYTDHILLNANFPDDMAAFFDVSEIFMQVPREANKMATLGMPEANEAMNSLHGIILNFK